MNSIKKPELLAPAGDPEKLKASVLYGADAVYIGGLKYGLRANAKNFTVEEIKEGVEFAHEKGVKVYVTANVYARNGDIGGLKKFFTEIYELRVDAVIISDPGVFAVAAETVPDIKIHISTQANNTNYRTVQFWREHGASRVTLARELPLEEITEIRRKTPGVELEAFVHGAMCVSYSGRCLLSDWLTGRGANRGDCSQPCRWEYYINKKTRPGEYMPIHEDERGTYLLNSKDLCMIGHIPELIAAGVDSLKIEGRMKSVYYTAAVVGAYRRAIDDYFTDPGLYRAKLKYYLDELNKTSHREFTTGFYLNGGSAKNMQSYDSNEYASEARFVGLVINYDPNTRFATVEQRNKISSGDVLEIITPTGERFTQVVTELYNESGEPIADAPHPRQTVKFKTDKPVRYFCMLRKI